MKKLVVLFSVLAFAFISCDKDDDNDGELKEQQVTYAGSYEGAYKMADTTIASTAIFTNALLKDGINLYGVVNFKPTDTTGFFRANVDGTQLSLMTTLLNLIGVNTPNNLDDIIKCLNATAQFDGEGKVNMKLDFDVNVNIGDTVNLNWQLITFEGLRK